MLIGAVADDFTGASDLANTIAKTGMATTLFVGVPPGGLSPCEAGVVALKSRSNPVAEAVAQSLEALAALEALGAQQIIFKYCSTFDSTKEGNIGPVADALADKLGIASGIIVCPAFPTNGRTIYRGHLFVGDKLLNESGMEKHPITPMIDANIARWMSYQSVNRIGLVPLHVVRQGVEAVKAAFAEAAARKERFVVCDATSDEDLLVLGAAAKGHRLVTGGSGIALGLPANFAGARPGRATPPKAPKGRALALSGSCSNATRGQVARHKALEKTRELDVPAILAGDLAPAHLIDWLMNEAAAATLPLVYSSAEPEVVKAMQERFGGARVAHAIEEFFAELARLAVAAGFRRIITAGGETSSAIVSGLGITAMSLGPEIDPGVPVVVSAGPPSLALALKSGNFGAPDFFVKALGVMEGIA